MANSPQNIIGNETASVGNPLIEGIINGQLYEYDVVLQTKDVANPTSVVKEIRLNTESIALLEIEEDATRWWRSGKIIVNTKYESLERPADETGSSQFYRFNSDGTDELYINIKPDFSNIESNDTIANDIPDNLWRIRGEFVIYDVQDMESTSMADKFKVLYFWEKKKHELEMKQSYYSTGESEYAIYDKSNPQMATDAQRSITTGQAIYDVLKTCFPQNMYEIGDAEHWDIGSEKILYTSFDNSLLEDLKYFHEYHVSKDKFEPCLLRLERPMTMTDEQKFTLLPLSHYFNKAGNDANTPGDYQIEHFFIEDIAVGNPTLLDNKAGGGINPLKAPSNNLGNLSNDSFKKDVKMANFNTIRAYQFVPMASIDNLLIDNKQIVNYNFNTKQFNVYKKEGRVPNVQAFINKEYVNALYTKEPDTGILPAHNTTIDLNNKNYKCSTYYEPRVGDKFAIAQGRNKLIMQYLFNNLTISFNVQGVSLRQPARWIGIDKHNDYGETDFDNRLQGQWFVKKVTHIFAGDQYINNITAVKLHSYAKPNVFIAITQGPSSFIA